MAINFLQFVFNLILAGFLLNFIKVKLLAKNPNSEAGKALAFVTA